MAFLATDAMTLVVCVVIFVPAALLFMLFRRVDRRRVRLWANWHHRPFLALKGFLIAMGVYLVIARAYVEFHEGHLGIGLGMVVTMSMAFAGGLIEAISGHTPDSPAAHQDPPPSH